MEKRYHFSKSGNAFSRLILIHTKFANSGCIFHILQYFATKLSNFTKFRMLFPAVLVNFPGSKFSLIGEWSIRPHKKQLVSVLNFCQKVSGRAFFFNLYYFLTPWFQVRNWIFLRSTDFYIFQNMIHTDNFRTLYIYSRTSF